MRQVCPTVLASVLRCMGRWEDGRPPFVCREIGDSLWGRAGWGRGDVTAWEFQNLEMTDGVQLPPPQMGWRGSSLPKVTQRPPDRLESGFRNIGPPLHCGSSRSKGPLRPWVLLQFSQVTTHLDA